MEAKKKFGEDRKRFRKATPRQPLIKRIQEATKLEREKEEKELQRTLQMRRTE